MYLKPSLSSFRHEKKNLNHLVQSGVLQKRYAIVLERLKFPVYKGDGLLLSSFHGYLQLLDWLIIFWISLFWMLLSCWLNILYMGCTAFICYLLNIHKNVCVYIYIGRGERERERERERENLYFNCEMIFFIHIFFSCVADWVILLLDLTNSDFGAMERIWSEWGLGNDIKALL